ncbi:PHP domain-containing protein [uncultured Olsenella sp.]|uniref:PHP domain-containing protein n=1 Tax=uncultured Olsenella sp. TaxID=190764 RepID=UPI0026DC37D7|nr:hypothetical protein [uncultured Olsenella sp.]
MKIDLHCHTKKCKQGDSPNRNVCPEDFKKAVDDAQVDIVAITNHNTFDLEQFNRFNKELGEEEKLWPGVELDVCGSRDKSHWHMLVITGPSKKDQFNTALQQLTGSMSPDKVLVNVGEVFSHFRDIGAIFISHAHDKSPHISPEDMSEMETLIGEEEKWRLFYEPRSLVTVGIWTNHGFNMMLGSDVQDWNKYPNCELPDLRLPVSSFEQFCLLAKRDGKTIETLLGKRGTFNVIAHPHAGVDVSLTLREDINVMFGQKGTGKTEILKSIEKVLLSEGRTCCSYYGNEKHEGFNTLLSTEDLVREPSRFGRTNGSDEISKILNWSDATPTSLSAYVTWWSTRGNNNNKDRFELSNAQNLDELSDSAFTTDQKANKAVSSFVAAYRDNGYGSYLEKQDADTLLALLEKLGRSIHHQSKEHFIEYRSIELANIALAKIKNEIDAKSETKSKPGSTGFLAFVKARIELKETAEKLINALAPINPNHEFGREYLGDLGDKGDAYIVTRYRYLSKESKTKEFEKGIRDLRTWKIALEELRDEAMGPMANAKQQDFAARCNEHAISDLSPFIGISRYIALDESNDEYAPSSGEEGILLLSHTLNKDADVYILDEAELGMSNSYVDAVIRERIQKLARQGKAVVLATHNANLAVRTLPYLSVYREHDNGVYRTYIGNPFTDELVDINDSSNVLSWTKKSLEVLEGSKEAFYNRRDVYEAGMR